MAKRGGIMLPDKAKTREQLISELAELHQRIAELEALETERKQVEEVLRESEEKYRTLVEDVPTGIYFSDFGGMFLYGNKKAEEIVGYKGEELLGKSYLKLKLLDLKGIGKAIKLLALNKLGKATGPDDFVLNRKDGTKSIVSIRTRITTVGGKEVVLGMVEDITEHKQVEEALHESEAKYKALFESTLDGAFIIDAETMKVVLANQAAAKLYGFDSVEDAVGVNLLDLIPPDDGERAIRIIAEDMFKKDLRQVNEFRTMTKGGREIWVSAIGARIEYQGKVAGLISFRDTTEGKEAAEALRESEARYRGLVTNVKVGIFRSTPEPAGRFLEVNPALERITGYSRKELLQMNVYDLYVYPQERELVLEEVASGRGEATKEVFFRKKDGTEIVVLDRKVVVRNESGQILYFDGILEDITERKQAEEREKGLQRELNLASRLAAIGELAAGVAHELNNPLTGILGFSQRLLRKSTDETSKRDLERIHDEISRAAKVVENLRTFARRREPKKEYSDINDILQKTLELRTYELKTSNIEVALDLSPTLPKTKVDFQQIQEVFLNLILNAEQAMSEANLGRKLVIKTQPVKDYIRTSFTDDGPGISAENLSKLFDPFFTTRGGTGGTGLGLSVCHGIVVEHGGRIYVRSKPGRGATFVVELPCP